MEGYIVFLISVAVNTVIAIWGYRRIKELTKGADSDSEQAARQLGSLPIFINAGVATLCVYLLEIQGIRGVDNSMSDSLTTLVLFAYAASTFAHVMTIHQSEYVTKKKEKDYKERHKNRHNIG